MQEKLERFQELSAGKKNRTLIFAGIIFSIFFLFTPGKETAGNWLGAFVLILLICELMRSGNEQLRRLILEVYVAIFISLSLHILIGWFQVTYRFYSLIFNGVVFESSLRNSLSIGVRNLSIICSLCTVLGYSLSQHYPVLKVVGYVLVILSLAMIGLLHSWSGIFCILVYIISELIRHKSRNKRLGASLFSKNRSIFDVLIVGFLVMLVFYPLAGGLERVRQLYPSLNAAVHREAYRSWIEPEKFALEFCYKAECDVNASIYYRLTWVFFGVETILENPRGIGNVDKPLELALKKKFPNSGIVADDFHSELISFGVKFGLLPLTAMIVIGVLSYVYFFLQRRDQVSLLVSFASGFYVVISTRLTIDSIGVGGVGVALTSMLLLSIIAVKFEHFSRCH